jgi:hypothetical protein
MFEKYAVPILKVNSLPFATLVILTKVTAPAVSTVNLPVVNMLNLFFRISCSVPCWRTLLDYPKQGILKGEVSLYC